MVTVVHGDITKETTDVIVNSTNENLDLSKGISFYILLNSYLSIILKLFL